MDYNLSRGALATIMRGGDISNPIVQVLSLKKMNASSAGEPDKTRYRAFLSDGQYTFSFAMLTAQVYGKAGDKGIPKFTIIKIPRFITTVINNSGGNDSRVLLILDLEVIADGDEVQSKIGDPVPYTNQTETPVTNGQASSSVSNGPTAAKVPKLLTSTDAAATTITNGNNSTSNGNLAGHITHPISSLSPYHNKWIIKARVTSKSNIRSWSNSRGEGQLFSFDLADEGGEIRCTGFRDAVTKYYSLIEVDKVYYISKCQLKPANKQYSSLKNDYEMTITPETIIEECHDDDVSNIPKVNYSFVEIDKLAQAQVDTMVDVIGVVKAAGELQTFQSKTTNRELKKKEIQLVDQSNAGITLTLWGADAENFDGSDHPVLALKGARVSEFGGGKNLSSVSSTSLRVNPEIPECYRLKGWYDTEGSNVSTTDLSARSGAGTSGSFSSPWLSFKQATDQQLGSTDTSKGDYYQVKGTVLLLRAENAMYKACPEKECNKKVVDQGNGYYRCEKCNKEYNNFKYRLICSMNVGDWSGNQWLSMFNDEAEKIIGMTADEVGQLLDSDKAAYNEAMERAHFTQFIFKCRAKMETYNDEQRLKTVAVRVDPVNHQEYNAHLINNINQLTGSY